MSCVMCHVSGVRFQVSNVTCLVSCVISYTGFINVVKKTPEFFLYKIEPVAPLVLVSDPPNGYSIIGTYTHTLSEIIHTISNLISGLMDKFRKITMEVINDNNV